MSLFRRADNSLIHFNCVELSKNELEAITKLIEENGGAMGTDHLYPIKFIPNPKYKPYMGRTHRLYSIEFIKECVRKNEIVDFKPYRLSKKRHGEHCTLSQYLTGCCYYKELVKQRSDGGNIPDSSSSDEELMERNESQSLISNIYSRTLRTRNSSLNTCGQLTDRNDVNHAEKSKSTSISERHSTPNLNISRSRKLEVPVHSSADTGSFETALESEQVKNKIVDSPRQTQSTVKTSTPSNRSLKSSIVDIETISLIDSSDENSPNVCISPQEKLKLCDVPSMKCSTPKSNDKRSGKRIIPKASSSHQSPEKVSANGLSWIAPKDIRMQNMKSTDRIHPLTEYVECNSGKVPLLRINSALKNGPKTPNSDEKEQSKNTAEINDTTGGRKMPNSRDDSKPGVSGLNSRKPAKKVRSASITNGEETEPVRINNSRQTLVLNHSHKNAETVKRKKKRKLYVLNTEDINDLIGSESDDEREAVRTKMNMRKKAKTNGRLNRISDSSDDDEKITKIANKVKRESSSSDECNDSSDEDKKTKMPNKGRRKYHSSSEENERKRKNIQYAKRWRCKLEEDIPKENRRVSGLKITKNEQEQIIKYLCSHDDIISLQPKGFKVWQELLKTGILRNRTAQSLQNHFMKILLPNIHIFFNGMSEEHKKQFKALQAGNRE